MSAAMPMPHRWSRALPIDKRLTMSDIAAGRALALHMDAKGGSCYPTHALVAYEARLAERTVRAAISHLIRCGWLEQMTRSAPGRAASYRAIIPTVPDMHRCARNTVTVVPPNPGTVMPPLGEHRHRDATEQRHVTAATPAQGCRPGIHQVANDSREPFRDDFDIAWLHYPRKIAKGAAKKAYTARRHAGVPAAELLSATQNYAMHIAGSATPAHYTMHGSTFYGPDERWRDYLDEPDAVSYDAPAVIYR